MFFLFRKLFSLVLIMLAASAGYYFGFNHGREEVKDIFRDATYLGFVHGVEVDENSASMFFDDAVWLSGKKGQDAAIAAGLCTEETRAECLSNDYFISNISKEDEKVSVDPNTLIFMKTYDAGDIGIVEKEISVSDFALLTNDSSAHWNKLPYNVTIQDGKVVRIEEVYIP